MATTKEAWSTSTTITCTIDSLASSQTVGRASTAVDNTANLYLDALVSAKVVLAAGTPANDQAVYFYVYGGNGDGNYTEGCTGTDASFTINNPTSLRLIGVLPTPTGGITYYPGPFSVSNAFGGILPPKWGIVVVNYSGLALGTGNTIDYAGLTVTSA